MEGKPKADPTNGTTRNDEASKHMPTQRKSNTAEKKSVCFGPLAFAFAHSELGGVPVLSGEEVSRLRLFFFLPLDIHLSLVLAATSTLPQYFHTDRPHTMAMVRAASLAVLGQKRALLASLQPNQYTQPCALVGGGSVGQHLRHSLDHYRKCLEGAASSSASNTPTTIAYDVRDRGTSVETDLAAARQEIDRLMQEVQALPDAALATPVQAAFVLSAEGEQAALASTLGRELGFCTHHAIHHNALIRAIANDLGIKAQLPPDFGLAPSTTHYNKTHPH